MNSVYDFRVMRVLRRRMNLTLHELARRSGLTYPTVEAVETNKTQPSLKTLDAVAGALDISTSDLVRLAERRLVQRRKAEFTRDAPSGRHDTGVERCRIAQFDKGKVIRVTAAAGETVHVMGLHENIHEFCYVLAGHVDLRIEDKTYHLGPDDTILFDGLLDHSYVQREAGEYLTVHVPKDIRVIERLLEAQAESIPSD
ncbi:MAG: helix-turn-helix domain-containing protein [Planctomycetes bacterium]|nr:helix-turn-helix domain-containing protein [Planctomycetota bacterium]